jgi:hypothetical protein
VSSVTDRIIAQVGQRLSPDHEHDVPLLYRLTGTVRTGAACVPLVASAIVAE